MAIKLDMLRCFVAVAETGKLTDAAHRLGRSPSAVSMMLKQFEDHLGENLFDGERKNRLSPVGLFALEQAQSELRHFDQMVQAIEGFARAEQGQVRLAAVPSVAGGMMPRVLGQFRARHPKVRLVLRDMDSRSIHQALVQGQLDIGIATLAQPGPLRGIERVGLFADHFGVICAPDHPFARRGVPVSVAELVEQEFITNDLCEVIENNLLRRVSQGSSFKAPNIISLLAMVRAGLGVTVLPQSVARLDPMGVAFCPFADLHALRQIDMLVRQDGVTSPAAQRLAELIVQIAAQYPPVTPLDQAAIQT